MVSEGERISTARSGEPLKNPLGGRLNPCNRFLLINDTSGERRLPDFIRYHALEPNTAPSLRSETNLSNAAESFITIFSCSIPAGTITSSPFTNSCLYPFSGKDSSSFSVHVFFATVVSIEPPYKESNILFNSPLAKGDSGGCVSSRHSTSINSALNTGWITS